MDKVHQKIWDLALEYQDLRDDKGHAEIVVSYSQKLLDLIEANPDIVIPTAILHDIGWSQMPRDEIVYKKDGDRTPEEERVRRLRHQVEGVKKGRELLNQVNYDRSLSEQILEIMSEHDTREGSFSIEDSVVRDADKLWRFSDTGFWIAIRNLKIPPQQEYAKLERQIDEKGFFFTEEARTIARKELKQRAKEIEEKKKEAC